MKKSVAILLSAVLFLVLIPCTTSAAPTVPSLYMRPQFNATKDHLTVEIYTNGLNWTSLDLGLKFDTTALTLVSISEGGRVAEPRKRGSDMISGSRDAESANQLGYGNFVAAVSGANHVRPTDDDFPVVIFAFTVKDLKKAKSGYDLCISHLTDAKGNKLLDYTTFLLDAPPVVHLSNAKNPFRYGDVTGDGKVTISDAMVIMQYKAEMTSLNKYQIDSGDVSGDRSLTVSDAMVIMQYLAGMMTSLPSEG